MDIFIIKGEILKSLRFAVKTVIINVIAVEFKVKVYLWDVILFKPDLLESLFYLFLRCQLGYPVRAHHLSFVFVSVEQGRD